jgi:hypothetical protein
LLRLVHALTHRTTAIAHTITHVVEPRVKVVEHTVTDVITHDLPTVRAGARAAEDRALATYKWLRAHPDVFLTGVFTGAAAWALTRLGGGWIRCKNWREIGKRVCRMPWSTIEGLLTLALGFATTVDPLPIAKASVVIADELEGLIEDIANPSQAVTEATEIAMDVLTAIASPFSG